MFSPTFCLETICHLPQLLPLSSSGMVARQLLQGRAASLRDFDDQANTEQSGQGLGVVGLVPGKIYRQPPIFGRKDNRLL